jgi:tetratricopeptide (TPR) repeat protein
MDQTAMIYQKFIFHRDLSSVFALPVISAGLLLFCFLLAGCRTPPEQKKADHLAKGNQYLKEKKLNEARLEFRSALLLDKKFGDAWFGLGEAALQLNNVKEAFDSFAAAVEADPNNLEARVRLGNIYLQYVRGGETSTKEAENLAKIILQKNPNHIEGHILMASVRTSQKRWDDARAELDRAIALDPKRSESLLSLARFFEQRAKIATSMDEINRFNAEADRVFRQAIETSPNSALARLAISDFYFSVGRKNDAEAELKKAFDLDSKDKLVLAAMQRFYENLNRFDEAEKYGALLAEFDPDKNNGRAQLIDLHARAGKLDQAIQEYEQLTQTSPKFLRAYARLAELLIAKGDAVKAESVISKALTINKQDTDCLLMRGRLHLLNGRFREAEADLAQVLKQEPSMPAALYFMADTHLQNNEPEKARQNIADLLRYYPSSPTGMLMLARIHLSQGKADEAIKTADELINGVAYLRSNENALQASRLPVEMLPDLESKAFTTRGVARIQLRDLNGAQADLDKAAAIDQRSTEPNTNLSALYMLKNDLGRAQAEAEKALAKAPDNSQVIQTALKVYTQKKDFVTAHSLVDKQLASQPDNAVLMDMKAQVYAFQEDKTNYEKMLQQIIQKKPEYLNAYFELSAYYHSQNKTNEAIAQLQEVIKRRPGNSMQMAQAYVLSGMLEEARGRYDEAAKNYELSLGYDKRSGSAAIASNNLAWLTVERIRNGNLDKAAELAKSAIAITPEPSFYDTLGWIFYKKGLHGVAIEQYNKALDKNPKNPIYHLHMARARRENGDLAKARESFKTALELGGEKFSEAKKAREELAALN